MPRDEPGKRHQRERWLRPDAHLWIRPDAARFYAPGTDLADVFPTLARKRDAEEAAAAAEIAAESRQNGRAARRTDGDR